MALPSSSSSSLLPAIALILHLFSASASTSHPTFQSKLYISQLHSLLAFKQSITNDPLSTLSSWNSTLHPNLCTWPGILCSPQTHLVLQLDLPDKALGGTISPSLCQLPHLTLLNLSHNHLSGPIPSQLGHCSSLQVLDLTSNRLLHSIPLELGHLTSLEELSLSANNLTGEIPPSLAANCTNLQFIDLSFNHLTGVIPSNIGLLNQLRSLQLTANQISGTIPTALANCTQLVLLQFLQNNLSGNIPEFLGSLQKLSELSLDYNQLNGHIPPSLTNCSNLRLLYLTHNRLMGPIPSDLGKLHNLVELKLFNNNLTGPLPPSLVNCSNLALLDLSFNPLNTTVPPFLGEITSLSQLALQGNSLTGGLPEALGNLTSLITLSFYSNSLTGVIPPSIGKLGQLQDLELEGNMFSGHIPQQLLNCTSLALISMGLNSLTGDIPHNFCKHIGARLQILYLNFNRFTGNLPSDIADCTGLLDLDVSFNKLTGSIPSSLGQLQSIYNNLALSHNGFTGSIPVQLGSLTGVQYMSLATNNLSGTIPPAVGGCLSLLLLDLSGNQLNGSIPDVFGKMRNLQQLNLADNSLSGLIPASLANMSTLWYLNLSDNQLRGPVPETGVFLNTTALHLRGNPGLCGSVVHVTCPKAQAPTPIHSTGGKASGKHWRFLIMGCVLGGSTVVLGVALYWRIFLGGSKQEQEILHGVAEQFMKISAEELQIATDGFSESNIIGDGNLSTVYKGCIGEGKLIAIKVLKLDIWGEEAERLFNTECRALAQLRHRNVVKVLSCCSNLDMKAIVLEYMPQGSLENLLQGCRDGSSELSWEGRLRIALDVAMGLEYLHHDCAESVIHCDIKPSNILLADDRVAKVADFGIAKLVSHACNNDLMGTDWASVSRFKGTIGYAPPEYAYSSRVSIKGDVYSYGVVLLEMVTGKSPTRDADSFLESLNLVGWAEKALSSTNPYEMLIDRGLKEQRERGEDCGGILSVVKLGLACTRNDPKDRPSMRQVVAILESKSYID